MVAMVIGFIGIKYISLHVDNFNRRIEEMTVTDVDLSMTADGKYIGAYILFPISARVEVTLEDSKIAAIEIVEHKNGRGAEAEAVVERVIEDQTLEVDAVTGATYSSKIILKAIEIALKMPSISRCTEPPHHPGIFFFSIMYR